MIRHPTVEGLLFYAIPAAIALFIVVTVRFSKRWGTQRALGAWTVVVAFIAAGTDGVIAYMRVTDPGIQREPNFGYGGLIVLGIALSIGFFVLLGYYLTERARPNHR